MKCLVIFYSKYGQTEKIATRIADKLRSSGASADVKSADHLDNSRQL